MDIVIPIVIGILVIGIFAFCILKLFSPKQRAKSMSKHLKKTMEYMVDNSKDELSSIGMMMDSFGLNNETIKNGLTSNKTECSSCFNQIDSDSKFCKYCGKEQ